MQTVYTIAAFAPLFGAVLAGFFGQQIGRVGAHSVTIAGVAVSFVLSLYTFYHLVFAGGEVFNAAIYTWLISDGIRFEIGFLVDNLTAIMMVVVTGVSLLVHIYTIGYMQDDPGYQRFFSYISLFTFSMLMLVMANNLLQLFFGWEAVGLVSYLLIGFWYQRQSAIFANLKAFLVNRVGDFGFLLGIAVVVYYTNSLNYNEIFAKADNLVGVDFVLWPGFAVEAITLACILLFIGAMGKSAQMPLHVWLPDSMEGPTPISALIHAATMVTAGIFMVARLSPLFELSTAALLFIMTVGALTALLMGLIGLVQNDIKRVVAYSTLSQLGYMTVALGVSAYSAAIFHLFTHAFFKALLFLAAGSVIIALHHEQNMQKMGGLWRKLPITYATAMIGALALIGFPGFAGFFSKDLIIEAVHASHLPFADVVYWLLLIGVFVTAFYTFRMIFLVFHGKPRDQALYDHAHESPKVVTLPLILLAIPSLFAGFAIGALIFSTFFDQAIYVAEKHDVIAYVAKHYHGVWEFILHGLKMPSVWLAFAGVALAWFFYLYKPQWREQLVPKLALASYVLEAKYGFDRFNQVVFAAGSRFFADIFAKITDKRLIDGVMVNGSAQSLAFFGRLLRYLQTGVLSHYAFVMIVGLLAMSLWLTLR